MRAEGRPLIDFSVGDPREHQVRRRERRIHQESDQRHQHELLHRLDPDEVHLPGVYVQRVLPLTDEQAADKRIEKRTVTETEEA